MKRLIILVLIVIVGGIIIRNTDIFNENPQTETQTEINTEENQEETSSETDITEEETDQETQEEIETEEQNKTQENHQNEAVSKTPDIQKPVKTETPKEETVLVPTPKKEEATSKTAPEAILNTTKVKIYMYEWNIDIMKNNIPAGNIEFEIINTGKRSHIFGIMGMDDFGKVKPGERRAFTTQLESGEYTLYSSGRIDQEQGMMETFWVE